MRLHALWSGLVLTDRIHDHLAATNHHRPIALPNRRRNGIHIHHARALYSLRTIRDRNSHSRVHLHGVPLCLRTRARERERERERENACVCVCVRILQIATCQQCFFVSQENHRHHTHCISGKHGSAETHLVRKWVHSINGCRFHRDLLNETAKVSPARQPLTCAANHTPASRGQSNTPAAHALSARIFHIQLAVPILLGLCLECSLSVGVSKVVPRLLSKFAPPCQ